MLAHYHPTLSLDRVNKELKKLKKLNYNRFMWWRLYDQKNPKLHHRCPLIDRIKNGDFDPSHFKYQVELCEHELNAVWDSCCPDMQMFIEKTTMLRARRKRLIEDYNKDETERLELAIKGFVENFSCTKEQVYEEIDECSGTLEDLYYIIEKKYSHPRSSLPSYFNKPKRGRPAKLQA